MKKIVGITSDYKYIEDVYEKGYKRFCINEDYSEAIEKANGIPIIIPITHNDEILNSIIEVCDALVISGGSDVNPFLYGEERKNKLLKIKPDRDEYEKKVYFLGKKKNIPILGICRGMQLINVLEGGTLYQDLSYRENLSDIQHNQKDNRDYPSHLVEIDNSSFLGNIFKQNKIAVNSYHHQAIKNLALIFKEIAKSSDNIIEAFENRELNIYGIQWHPEKMLNTPSMLQIFKEFLNL